HAVTGGFGIDHLQVHDAVDGDFDVVLGDTTLAWHVAHDFLQGMFVGHFIDERHENMHACFQRGAVLAEPFHHVDVPLRNDTNGHPQQHDDAEGDQCGNNQSLHNVILTVACRLKCWTRARP